MVGDPVRMRCVGGWDITRMAMDEVELRMKAAAGVEPRSGGRLVASGDVGMLPPLVELAKHPTPATSV